MNEKQVKRILEEQIGSLTKSAKIGIQRQGLITGTKIIGGCSPGKINFTYTADKPHTWIAVFLKEKGFKKGRHDKKIMHGETIRAFTKIVDEEMEREFNIKEYGRYKK